MGKAPKQGVFPFLFLKGGMIVNHYTYDGPVMSFNFCVSQRWKASTYAVSKRKALSNLAYQYKVAHNLTPNTSIWLPGKLTITKSKEEL